VARLRDTVPSTEKRASLRIAGVVLLCALVLCAAGCGSYASQAEKYTTEASSEVAGTVYVLERFHAGEVSGPFVRSSLQQYAKAMQSTTQSLRSLKPPPEARTQQERAVEALDRSQRLAQEAGQKGVPRQEASQLAKRLRVFGEELKNP
jgi:hypothetical protein